MSNPSSLLKILHDHFPQFKVIASGSSSFNIKKKFKDTLVGRTVDFELHPLDFEEFLTFKDKDISLSTPITVPALVEELDILYREYTLYGGYPKIVLTPEIDKKETYLQQIIDTYINNDIRDIGNIRHVEKFNKNSLFFWRTQDKKELDFVVQHNSSLTAIEVKLNAAKCSLTPMRYFNSHYSPKLKLCVSLQGSVKRNDIELRACRPWDLIRLINGS